MPLQHPDRPPPDTPRGRHARLDHQAGLGKQIDIYGTSSWIGHIQGQGLL